MRIPSVLLAAATACVLAASLTACSGADPAAAPASAGASASTSAGTGTGTSTGTALDLVSTVWHVSGRSGTTIRFDGLAVTVADGDRSSSYAWSAQGDQVLVGGGSSALDGPVDAAWLTATTEVQRTDAGWTLLDAAGAATAHLTADGTAHPTTATSLLVSATPGDGVVDAPSSTIGGRWTVAGDAHTAITFTSGTWSASTSCTTGAVGGSGVYRVLPGGRLLVIRTTTPIRGCPVTDGPLLGQASAITAIARAATFRVRSDTLTLFDRAGTELGSLTRG